MPFELLGDVEARRDDPVQIEILGDGRVLAGWRDGNVPQMTQYEPVEAIGNEAFPGSPGEFAENPPELLRALHKCVETTDPYSVRYALSCVQLRGKGGTIVGTDGRQSLICRGFEFPWEEDLLLPGTNVFGSKELPDDKPVQIGKTEDWITVRVGRFQEFANRDGSDSPAVGPVLVPSAQTTLRSCLYRRDFLARGRQIQKNHRQLIRSMVDSGIQWDQSRWHSLFAAWNDPG